MNDPISDLLTRIRNAGIANHATVRIPHSRIKERIVEIMRDEGFLGDIMVDGEGVDKELVVHVKYGDGNEPVVHSMRRVSSPGRRVYAPAKEIPKVNAGLGVAIVSTSKGVLTDRDARRLNVGGEVLCEIW